MYRSKHEFLALLCYTALDEETDSCLCRVCHLLSLCFSTKKYWHEYTKEKAQSFNGLFLMLMIVFISMHPTLTAIPVRMMRGKQKTVTLKQIGSLQLWIHLNQVPAFWKQGIETGSKVLHCNSFTFGKRG